MCAMGLSMTRRKFLYGSLSHPRLYSFETVYFLSVSEGYRGEFADGTLPDVCVRDS